MAPSNRRNSDDKEARRRAKTWSAKQQVHEEIVARKRRDNLVSAIVLVAGLGVAVFLTVAYFTAGPGVASPSASANPSASAAAASSTTATANAGDVPSTSVAENRTWTGSMKLNGETVDISLDGKAAPQAVASFVSLANKGFFENVTCHRLVDDTGIHILQCGDPTGTGTGGPGYSFGPVENAPSDGVYKEGVIAMARASDAAYSNGSQFFIVFGESTLSSDSAGGYTVFGSVTSGLDVVKNIAAEGYTTDTTTGITRPKNTVTMTDVTVE